MQDHLALLAADLQVSQHHGLCGREVPVVARGLLVVPDVLAGVWIQRHDAGQVEVVPTGRAALAASPRRAVAGSDVHQVQLGVERHAVPGRATTASLPPLSCGIPGLGGFGHGFILKGLGRVARYGEPAPLLVARGSVIGRDVATHAVFCAAVADDDLALEDTWSACDGIAVLAVNNGVLFPHLGARGRIQRDKAAIKNPHEDLALIHRHAAVDHIAATLEAIGAVHAGIKAPEALAAAHVNGVHHAPAGADVHDAVHHHRSGFHAAGGFQVVRPGQAQILHVPGVELL